MVEITQIDTQMTPAAEAFIRRFLRFAPRPNAGFQLRVAPGGCSGYATTFDLVAKPMAGHIVWEYAGMRVFLDAASCKLLEGATVDFIETLSHTGFAIKTQGAAPA